MSAVASATRVDRLRSAELPALRAFLRGRPDAHIFHSPEWLAVLRDTYGHTCDYWVAWEGDSIAGVFPVLVVRAPALGTKMVALGYQMDSGLPLADCAVVAAELVGHAAAEARRAGVKYIEVRSLSPAPMLERLGFTPVDSGLVTTVVRLDGIELRTIRRGHRRTIRYAEEQGVTVRESRSLADLYLFQRLYLASGRAIGAPQAGRRYFESLHRHAAANYRLYLASAGGRVLGGMVTVGDERVTYARHAAYGSPEAMALHVGTVLCWRGIHDAAAEGVERFNCGISWERDNGLIQWKEGWGGETVPVRLYTLPVRGAPPLPRPGDYLGGFGLARAVWRRLPLPVAELGGNLVTRWIC
ncbi:MAG: GNAT family N-acetyltransferase [Gemmatimonadota bacterium]|nr:GNAT family N-acetyltransferase [Gemmatimonadota bacterium]